MTSKHDAVENVIRHIETLDSRVAEMSAERERLNKEIERLSNQRNSFKLLVMSVPR